MVAIVYFGETRLIQFSVTLTVRCNIHVLQCYVTEWATVQKKQNGCFQTKWLEICHNKHILVASHMPHISTQKAWSGRCNKRFFISFLPSFPNLVKHSFPFTLSRIKLQCLFISTRAHSWIIIKNVCDIDDRLVDQQVWYRWCSSSGPEQTRVRWLQEGVSLDN